jgi:hypothetical protein
MLGDKILNKPQRIQTRYKQALAKLRNSVEDVAVVAMRLVAIASYCTRSGGMWRAISWPDTAIVAVLFIATFSARSDKKLHDENVRATV